VTSVADEAAAGAITSPWVGLERCSIGEVCRRLRAQGIPSPKGKPYWDRTTVWGILKNSAYRGAAGFGKTQVGERRPRLRAQRGRPEQPRRPYSVYDTPERATAIAVPALVSEDLFAAVADQLGENRRRQRQGKRGARYLLQGLLVCQGCGYAYYGKQVSRRAAKGKHRRYGYYRCTGTDAYRFGGQRVCPNKQVRTDLLEEAVWEDVCALLKDPGRIQAEYERRLHPKDSEKESKGGGQLGVLIQKVKRGIARLIDAYGEGLVDKEEFEPRVQAFRERLTRLEAEAQQQQELAAQERELRLVMGRLQEFAAQVKAGLEEADWSTQREIIRALVKRVEIGAEEVRVVYRVNFSPFAESPKGGILPDCGRSDHPALG
jgi:site-specific DNA recombinase